MKWLRIVKTPEKLSGFVRLPASKSISNRALIIQALSTEKFPIYNLSMADDTLLLKAILETDEQELYIKNAGTAMRFLTAYFAQKPGDIYLSGSARMHERPISPLVDALRKLGAQIDYTKQENYPPLHISGTKLSGGEIHLSASQSSQFASALLLIAPTLSSQLTLVLEGEIVSAPYLDLTLKMLSYFGIIYSREGNSIYIEPQKYLSKPFQVENDWSSASYWYALAAVLQDSKIDFHNLFKESYQGDSILQKFIRHFGIETNFGSTVCTISNQFNSTNQHIFEADFIDYPDLIPTFVTLCCATKIPFKITGTKTLKYKESDRAEVLKIELAKLGFEIELTENSLSCRSFNQSIFPLDDIWLRTYDDHRMAMSWSILAAQHPNIWIENPDCVEKSYPDFWSAMQEKGFIFETKEI
ncbi:MAG: 3-phosphoshikimate 1-carboxyvinyltransferase [Bacteroidia bacterium]